MSEIHALQAATCAVKQKTAQKAKRGKTYHCQTYLNMATIRIMVLSAVVLTKPSRKSLKQSKTPLKTEANKK